MIEIINFPFKTTLLAIITAESPSYYQNKDVGFGKLDNGQWT